MPKALPRAFRALLRGRSRTPAAPAEPPAPAVFLTPLPAPKDFDSVDDALERDGARRERRDALSALRRSDPRGWREAP